MTEMTRTCDTCRFWNRLSPDGSVYTDANFDEVTDGTGQCRINPPQTVRYAPPVGAHTHSGDAAHAAWWPITWDGQWCGQHAPRLRVVGEEPA